MHVGSLIVSEGARPQQSRLIVRTGLIKCSYSPQVPWHCLFGVLPFQLASTISVSTGMRLYRQQLLLCVQLAKSQLLREKRTYLRFSYWFIDFEKEIKRRPICWFTPQVTRVAGAGDSVRVSHMGDRNSLTWAIITACQCVALMGSWNKKPELGVEPWPFSVGWGCSDCILTARPLSLVEKDRKPAKCTAAWATEGMRYSREKNETTL